MSVSDKRDWPKLISLTGIILLVLGLTAGALTIALVPYYYIDAGLISSLFTPTAILLAALIAFYYSHTSKSQREEESKSFAELRNRENDLAARLKGNETDFGSLWGITQERITLYHGIATRQASRSFMSTQLATVAGFVLIVVFGVVAAQATTPTAAIAAGAVGVVGAGLSAYISKTFMKSQSDASVQLQSFFMQPVEFTRLLAAERLLENLDPAEKSAAVQQIITAMMTSGPIPKQE